jgi:UDP-N-acetylmuramoyl-L-alanyl-D-glutamate--2,6-diaminopimelate ligase
VPDPVDPSTPRPTGVPSQRLAALAEAVGVELPPGTADVAVSGVTHDSRSVRAGDLYAALPGSRVHGARFAASAAAAGAVAALTDPAGRDETVGAGLPTLVADDPRGVLGTLAAQVYGDPATGLTTIGVTGTNGKTTTVHLLESGLRAAGHVTGLIGTIETRYAGRTLGSVRTTPEAPDLQALLAVMREADVSAVAMEVSSHALALGRVDGITYDVAVFTNLSEDHLDFHPDLEDYFATKASLFTPSRSRRGVVDVDDAYGARLARDAGVPITTVSPSGQSDADWRVTQCSTGTTGSSFVLNGPESARLECSTALVGTVNVANAALAVVALVVAGADPAAAASGVAACKGVPGRMERVVGPPEHDWLGLVDYAHSPDALERLLITARRFVAAGSRLHVVVGAGGDRDPYKRPGMGEIVARLADRTVLTSDNPRSEDPLAILAALRAGADRVPGARVDVVPDRRAAVERAVRAVRTGDVVVVAGKGHEPGQEVAGVVHPFDDRAVLREAARLVRR